MLTVNSESCIGASVAAAAAAAAGALMLLPSALR
jgi:hypothetical protein